MWVTDIGDNNQVRRRLILKSSVRSCSPNVIISVLLVAREEYFPLLTIGLLTKVTGITLTSAPVSTKNL